MRRRSDLTTKQRIEALDLARLVLNDVHEEILCTEVMACTNIPADDGRLSYFIKQAKKYNLNMGTKEDVRDQLETALHNDISEASNCNKIRLLLFISSSLCAASLMIGITTPIGIGFAAGSAIAIIACAVIYSMSAMDINRINERFDNNTIHSKIINLNAQKKELQKEFQEYLLDHMENDAQKKSPNYFPENRMDSYPLGTVAR
jgi:hypothetical protein